MMPSPDPSGAFALRASRCANHPDRPASAVCMACRRAVCQECATTWDGVNYCASCLAVRRRQSGARSSLAGWAAVAVAVPLLFFVAVKFMVWSGVLLAQFLD